MKLFLDTCIWSGTVEQMRRAGHDVVYSGDWEVDPGDEELLALARKEGRVVITLDKDFGELAVVRGARHRGIVRLVGYRAEAQANAALEALEKYSEELAAEAILTVQPTRVRVRPGPAAEQP